MHRALILIPVLLIAACPGDQPPDAGPADAGASVADAGGPDAGTEAPDGGPSDGGPAAEDGGEPLGDAGSCTVPDPCGSPPSEPVRFELGAAAPAFGPGASADLVVGAATRADVEAALGAPVTGDNPFRARHCAHGLRVEYVDDHTGDAFEGQGSTGDVVARVVTLKGAQLTSSNGVVLGSSRAAAQAALASPVSHELPVGALDADLAGGMLAVSDGSAQVASVALFRPQSVDAFGLPLDVAGGRLGPAGSGFAIGDPLTSAEALLGTEHDAEGSVAVEVFGGLATVNFWVRIYAAFGVRLVARCTGDTCGPSANLEQILLSPPFAGADGDVAIGATRAEVQARFGSGTANDEGVVRYGGSATGGRPLGVVFLQGESCEERAAALILNYTEAP